MATGRENEHLIQQYNLQCVGRQGPCKPSCLKRGLSKILYFSLCFINHQAYTKENAEKDSTQLFSHTRCMEGGGYTVKRKPSPSRLWEMGRRAAKQPWLPEISVFSKWGWKKQLNACSFLMSIWDSGTRSTPRWPPPQHGTETQWLSVAEGLAEKILSFRFPELSQFP